MPARGVYDGSVWRYDLSQTERNLGLLKGRDIWLRLRMPSSGFAMRRPRLPCGIWAINDAIDTSGCCSVAWFQDDGNKTASIADVVLLFYSLLQTKTLAPNGHASIGNACYLHK